MTLSSATDHIQAPYECAICKSEIEAKQAFISGECTACGALQLHVWCATKYTSSLVRTVHTNTKAIERLKASAKLKPWRHLEHMQCPKGWRDSSMPQTGKEGTWEARHLCNGRIAAAELVHTPREDKAKKQQHGSRPGNPATQLPTRQLAADRAKQPAARQLVSGPAVRPMSLEKAREFLGMASDEEEASDGVDAEEEEEEEDNLSFCDEVEEEAADFHPDQSIAAGAEGAQHGLYGPYGASSAGRTLAAKPSVEGAQSTVILTVEEAEVAVREGLLPASYRIRLCPSYLKDRRCPQQAACQDAHSLEELRTDAAIQAGLLPINFKTLMCSDLVQRGSCPLDRGCCAAHSPAELRVAAATRLGLVSPAYKTSRCISHAFHGTCPLGQLCSFAHGVAEVRREAAVQLGALHPQYKTSLCTEYRAYGSCAAGDSCVYAHGTSDLRRHAAVRDRYLMPTAFTALCPIWKQFGRCGGSRCAYAHGAGELLPHLITKGTLCHVWKETGACKPDCPFAHGSAALQLPLGGVRAKLQLAAGGGAAGGGTDTRCREAALEGPPAGGSSAAGSSSQPDGDPACASAACDGPAVAADTQQPAGSNPAPRNGPPSDGGSRPAPSQHTQQSSRRRHEARLQGLLGNRQRPYALRPCRSHDECGKCYMLDCPYAHGNRELRKREESWIDAELQRRRQRWEQRQEELRQQADAEAQERQQQAERLAELRQQQRQQEDAPPVQQLSAAALAQMGRHKLLQCTTALVEAGFDLNHAVVAAESCGGDAEAAFKLLLGDGPSDAGNASVRIELEAEAVLHHARQLGLPAGVADRAVLAAHGDWEEAKRQLEAQLEPQGGHGSGQAPLPLPLPVPLALPARMDGPAAPPTPGEQPDLQRVAEAGAGWGKEDWSPSAAPAATPAARGPAAFDSGEAAANGPTEPALGADAGLLEGFESYADVIRRAWREDATQPAAASLEPPVGEGVAAAGSALAGQAGSPGQELPTSAPAGGPPQHDALADVEAAHDSAAAVPATPAPTEAVVQAAHGEAPSAQRPVAAAPLAAEAEEEEDVTELLNLLGIA